MRSRPEIELLLPPAIFPGAEVPVELRLHSHSPTPVDRITLQLTGRETLLGRGETTFRYAVTFLSLATELARDVTLGATTHVYTSRFTLPPTAPSSFAGPYLAITYRLTAHVDIPWWPDARETYTIIVLPASRPRPERAPVIHSTAQGGAPFVEVQLDDTAFAPGDAVRGAVAAGNLDGSEVRRVDVTFIATEHGLPPYGIYTREVARYAASIAPRDVARGQALPFAIGLPMAAHPSFTATFARLAWALEVRLVRAWKADLVHALPIVVLPFDRPARAAAASAPRVGETRWREVFRRVGEPVGLALSADALELGGTISGVTTRIHVEQAGSRLDFIAQLGWDAWGIAIGLDRRTLPLGGIDLPDDREGFTSRFRVRGREPTQVRAALAPPLRQALLAFSDVRLADDHATVRRSARTHDEVDTFTSAVAWLARELRAAAARIPPPSSMASALPAWRALAEDVGGQLTPGGMRISGVFEGSRLGIATRFDGSPAPAATVITVQLDPPLDRGLDPTDPSELAALPAAAKALVAELTGEARRLAIGPEVMELELSGGVDDPATLLPRASSMLALARRLRGDRRAGPYR